MDTVHTARKIVFSFAAVLLVLPIHATPNATVQASATQISIGQVFDCNDSQTITLTSTGPVTLTAAITYAAGDVHDGWLYVKDVGNGGTYTNGTSSASISVTVNTSETLQIGLNSQIGVADSATVTLTTTSPAGQVITIPVSFSPNLSCPYLTANNGSISVMPANVSFSVTQGLSATHDVIVYNISASPVTFTPYQSTQYTWITLGLGTTTLQPGQSVAIPITVNASMPVGTYTGLFLVQMAGPGSNPITIPVYLTITGNGAGSGITTGVQVSPNVLSFSYVPGGRTPGPQALQISNQVGSAPIPFSVSATQFNGPANWLLTSYNGGNSAQTPSALSVAVNPLGLVAGVTYQGSLTITPLGGPAVEVYVAVAVAAPPVVTAAPSSLTFNYTKGGAVPEYQTVVVTGGGNIVTYSTVAIIPGWLSAYPPSGGAPNGTIPYGVPPGGGAYLYIIVNPVGLAVGTYTGTVTVYGNGPAVGNTNISVTLIVAGPAVSSVTSSASYAGGPVAPGEMISLFANSTNAFGPDTAVSLTSDMIVNNQLPTSMGGVQVVFLPTGVAAPLIYVSATQINCIVPYEVAGVGNLQVQVSYNGQTSSPFGLKTAVAQPALFTATSKGIGQGAIGQYDASGNYLGVNSVANPVVRGNTITLYVTGEGLTQPAITGRVTTALAAAPYTPQPLMAPSVLIDGQPATVTFYGEVPGVVAGMMQVNAIVPKSARAGADIPVSLSLGTSYSQAGVTLAAQ